MKQDYHPADKERKNTKEILVYRFNFQKNEH